MYRSGADVSTVEARRKNHTGWIYAPFVAQNLADSITNDKRHFSHLKVYIGKVADKDSLSLETAQEQGILAPSK